MIWRWRPSGTPPVTDSRFAPSSRRGFVRRSVARAVHGVPSSCGMQAWTVPVCRRSSGTKPGRQFETPPTKGGAVDRRRHERPGPCPPSRFPLARAGRGVRASPCGGARGLGGSMAVPSRVPGHRHPPAHLRPAVHDGGGNRPDRRVDGIAGAGAPGRTARSLVDPAPSTRGGTGSGADGARCADCSHLHRSRGSRAADRRSRLRPLFVACRP